MNRIKPGFGQGYVLRLEPSRRVSTVVGVLVTVIAATVLFALNVHDPGAWPETRNKRTDGLTAGVGFATVVLALGFFSALVEGRRWRLDQRIVRLSNSDTGRALSRQPAWAGESRIAAEIPPVVFDRPPGRFRLEGRLGFVDRKHNVIGKPPLHLAYLRIFDNQPRARTFVQGAWREFGYVYLLRSASSVSPREFRELKRAGPEGMFISSAADLKRELSHSTARPDLHLFRTFRNISAVTIRTLDRYGGYPPVALLCSGSYWQETVDYLLHRVDAVCLDLSGFRPSNAGTSHELQRVIDLFPIERVIFLIDPKSNRRFLEESIQYAWNRMAVGSPNTGRGPRRIYLAKTDRLLTTIQQDSHGRETGRQTRLIARRSETRRLAAWFQAHIASAPPVRRDPAADHVAATAAPAGVAHRPSPSGRYNDRTTLPWGWVGAIALLAIATLGVVSAQSFLLAESAPANTAPPTATRPPPPRTRPTAQTAPTTPHTPTPTAARETTVPVLVGLSLTKATAALTDRRLAVGQISRVLSAEPKDTVLTSRPKEGRTVPFGDLIDLELASGSNTVPDVVGMSVEKARNLLRKAGFKAVPSPEIDDDQAWTVVHQVPGQTSAELGSTVHLEVAEVSSPDPRPSASQPTTPE